MVELAERADDVERRLIGTLVNVLPQLSGRCDRMVKIDTVKFLNHAAGIGYIRPILDLLEITGVRTSQDFSRADYSAGSFLARLRLSRPGAGESLRPPYRAGSAFPFFTGREMEIVNALNGGETNNVIARQFGVTPETVKWRMRSLMRNLRASNLKEVVSNVLVLGATWIAASINDVQTGHEIPRKRFGVHGDSRPRFGANHRLQPGI
jgi:LuxR family maltose regulon positive regulatory protein